MKKIFILLCLTIISLCIASVSAIDNETITDAHIQTIDQQQTDVDIPHSIANVSAIDNEKMKVVPLFIRGQQQTDVDTPHCIANLSAIDNETMKVAPIHTIDQQQTDVDINVTDENNLETAVAPVSNNTVGDIKNSTTITDNATADNEKSIEQTAESNISGPEINDIPDQYLQKHMLQKKPRKENQSTLLESMKKDISHFSEIFLKNSGMTLYRYISYVFENIEKPDYTWRDIASIIVSAHNIAYDSATPSQRLIFPLPRHIFIQEVLDEMLDSRAEFEQIYGYSMYHSINN